MNDFQNWLSMGHYAVYVWSAYGIVITALAATTFSVYWKKKRTMLKLKHWFKRQS